MGEKEISIRFEELTHADEAILLPLFSLEALKFSKRP